MHVIIPKSFESADYSGKSYFVHFVNFYPFDLKSKERLGSNTQIINILRGLNPSALFFGYIRSHPEVALNYIKEKPSCTTFLIAHAKEIFFNSVKNNNVDGSHKGFTSEEIDFYKNTINHFNYVLPVSSFTKKTLSSVNISTKKLILPPAITVPSKVNVKKKFPSLLSVGRLITRKGQLNVIKLIPRLLIKYPNLKYNIIGSGPDGDSIADLIAELGLEKSVFLHQNISNNDLPNFYSSSSIFVLPTDQLNELDVEGFGIVFLEAGSYSLPVIGGKTGGVVDAIIDNKTGFLVEPRNVEELFSKLDLLLSSSKLRIKLGKAAFTNSKSYFRTIPSNKILNLIIGGK